ncbi:polyprenyl synthetase family protein [Calothrix sp. 336/3]|uniref:polyprenyl synthetase family protein n=1 Tax=Calothrix sp. 336/3 TaxID=1337936 RepID=UPI0004E2EDF9|nr:polyprenyl synthetase family protein [Calothrix sp. 336/3]AKG20399.1 hypothetical protein IJ00_02845 [Calothrix sp. 336/3]
MVQQLNSFPPASVPDSKIPTLRQFHHFPDDWPDESRIDLNIHDLPHNSSTLEWWYVNSHFTRVDGRKFSLFASFFRMMISKEEETKAAKYAHAIIWGISDVEQKKYYTGSLLDASAPEIILKIINSDNCKADGMLRRALREVLEQGKIPQPDGILQREVLVNLQKLELDFDGNRFVKIHGCEDERESNHSYHLTLLDREQGIECQLYFHPQKAAVRHGDQGVVRGIAGEDMFYYFIPQCQVEGMVVIEGEALGITEGVGWYDHEFGKGAADTSQLDTKHDIAWNWISAQLSNGYQISAFDLFDQENHGKSHGRWAVVIDTKGNWQTYEEFTFQPVNSWVSTRTFSSYPVRWQLEIPLANVSLDITATFPNQEFVTIISRPAFWEGRVDIVGNIGGEVVEGLGFVERTGFDAVETLEGFLRAVSRETQKSMQEILPLNPTQEQLCQLVASPGYEHYLQGLDTQQYSQALIQPIREMSDRGGKSWRSYAALVCLQLVGGNSQGLTHWLAWPELLHIGSLIVDDVEDGSTVRRGGASCHSIYGEALAINAGNASYFLGQILLLNSHLSEAEKLQVYELYFTTLRAAHAGQAIDIHGFQHLMSGMIEQGKGELLQERVLAVHRLKSAVPARSVAELGAILGGGTKTEIQALGNFFESLGLAFQIIDDVLNLKGFANNLKSQGEDISCGKITLPVAKAISRLPLQEQRLLWETIATQPREPEIIADVIGKLENCGAITACERQAEELVESAWQQLNPLFSDSDMKVRLRAFSWYVLARHY